MPLCSWPKSSLHGSRSSRQLCPSRVRQCPFQTFSSAAKRSSFAAPMLIPGAAWHSTMMPSACPRSQVAFDLNSMPGQYRALEPQGTSPGTSPMTQGLKDQIQGTQEPLGSQGPPQRPKDSESEPREPRKPYGQIPQRRIQGPVSLGTKESAETV